MRHIRHALTERHYTWEDAVTVAREDPEISTGESGLVYTPSAYEEEISEDQGWEEVDKDEVLTPRQETQKTTPELR